MRDRLRRRALSALEPVLDKATGAAERRRSDPAARAVAEERLLVDKFSALVVSRPCVDKEKNEVRIVVFLNLLGKSDWLVGPALVQFPRTFPDLYRGLVAVAAETGQLPEVLVRLADYLEARQARRQQFTLALIYPALVTGIAFAVIAVLLIYVVPQIVAVYQQSRQTLPWLTQALIATSGFVRGTAWIWLAGLAVAAIAFALANRREAFRARWHAAMLRVPGLGRLTVAIETARFASTLAILTGSGAPLLRSLDAARDVLWSLPIRGAATRAALLVREGVSLARALKEQRVFPPVLIHLTANGEASGQLAPMLERAAGELEREASRRISWFAALLQPALIVMMGAIVLVLVLAVMLPIVSMNQLIR